MKIQDRVLQGCLRRNGDQGLEQRRTCQVWRETHPRAVLQFQEWEAIEELDEEALRELRAKASQALERLDSR